MSFLDINQPFARSFVSNISASVGANQPRSRLQVRVIELASRGSFPQVRQVMAKRRRMSFSASLA
jgi:hypothetical protein